MFLIWHLWLTTTNLSYRFYIFETSATASCGSTGICQASIESLAGQHWIIGCTPFFLPKAKLTPKRSISWIYPHHRMLGSSAPKPWNILRRPGLANPKPSFCHCLAGRSKSFHPTNQPHWTCRKLRLACHAPQLKRFLLPSRKGNDAQVEQLPTALTGDLLGYIGGLYIERTIQLYGGFLKWWYPHFTPQNDHF